MTVSHSSNDDQLVPESDKGTQSSGALSAGEQTTGLVAINSVIPGGIPDFDNLLDGLASPLLTSQTNTTETESLTLSLTTDSSTSQSPERLESGASPIPDDSTRTTTILPSINHCLDDMEAIYATDRSFYDDYTNNIKKEPADYCIDPSTTTDLTPLKPALGLASAGFSSQQFTTSSQYSSPFLTNNDLCYANSYYHASPSVLNGAATNSSVAASQYTTDCAPFNSAPIAMSAYVDMESVGTENDLEKIQEKIDYASVTLGIPKDPQTWTCDQTHCWAEWTLNQYNIPLGHVTDFYVSGHTLCSLTQEEFTRRFSYYGDYLYPELDLWKNSFIMGNASTGSSSNVSSSEDEDSTFEQFTHSTNFVPAANSEPVRLFSSSVTGIPTPVITPLAQPISTASSGSVLTDSRTTSTLCWRDPMLMQGPTQNRLSHLGGGRVGSSMCLSPVSSLESNSSISWGENSQEDMTTLLSTACEPPVGRGKHAIHLWQFLKELLLQPHQFHNCIRWLDRNKGIFKIEDSSRVATLWGRRKNRPAMNYDKLSRSIRQYYKKGIIKKTEHSKRLVYQFQPQYR